MAKAKFTCGFHFCPTALRLLWPVKEILIKDIASTYGTGVSEVARRAELIGVADRRARRRDPKYSPAEFKKLWADETLRIRDIAKRLNMVERCVCLHAVNLGLPPRKLGSPRVVVFPDDFNEMWKAGVTTREIGEFIGCSHTLVGVEADRRKLPARGRSRKVKQTMYAYQLAKRAAAEQNQWKLAGMVDGAATRGRWAA